MAINNCLFLPTSENPQGFSVWCVLTKLSANLRATTHSRNVKRVLGTVKGHPLQS
jgi:hypothetical protein